MPPLRSTSGFQFLISSSCGVRSTTARSKMIVFSSAPGSSDGEGLLGLLDQADAVVRVLGDQRDALEAALLDPAGPHLAAVGVDHVRAERVVQVLLGEALGRGLRGEDGDLELLGQRPAPPPSPSCGTGRPPPPPGPGWPACGSRPSPSPACRNRPRSPARSSGRRGRRRARSRPPTPILAPRTMNCPAAASPGGESGVSTPILTGFCASAGVAEPLASSASASRSVTSAGNCGRAFIAGLPGWQMCRREKLPQAVRQSPPKMIPAACPIAAADHVPRHARPRAHRGLLRAHPRPASGARPGHLPHLPRERQRLRRLLRARRRAGRAPGGLTLTLVTDHVDEWCRHLKAHGVEFVKEPPTTRPIGSTTPSCATPTGT